jgi:hypothetical protein
VPFTLLWHRSASSLTAKKNLQSTLEFGLEVLATVPVSVVQREWRGGEVPERRGAYSTTDGGGVVQRADGIGVGRDGDGEGGRGRALAAAVRSTPMVCDGDGKDGRRRALANALRSTPKVCPGEMTSVVAAVDPRTPPCTPPPSEEFDLFGSGSGR